jgi:hypothetical protein
MALALGSLSVAAGLGPGCRRPESGQTQQTEQDSQIVALARLRQARESTLAVMDVPQLARELEQESRTGVEPFNSMPLRTLVARGRDVGAALRSLLTTPDRSSFLGLLALRRVDSTQYQAMEGRFRVAVLVDALQRATTFNAWGLPHLKWEEAAQALIGEGREAQAALRPLLEDCREAPMWGSEEVLESRRYGYRLCDYAWALMVSARGEQLSVPESPAERDRLISQVRAQRQ